MRNTTSKLFFSILYPSLFVAILWGVLFVDKIANLNLNFYGLYPRTISGLLGIITTPLLHANASHLFSNTIPLLILGTIIFYFYRPIAFQIFFWIYFMTDLWVWVMARSAYHIGASGIIYGFVTFLFFSGVFRKDTRLLALSLFVVFIYGSTAWGIFPIKPGMSWESHLMGSLAGLITAFHFKKEGPLPPKYDLGTDEENEAIDVSDVITPNNINDSQHPTTDLKINYTILPGKKNT